MNGYATRNYIISRLSSYLDLEIRLWGQSELIPSPPYGYYTNLTADESETHLGVSVYEPIDENNVWHLLGEQFVFTISLNFVGKTEEEAYFLCKKARDWFMHVCYDDLTHEDIVIRNVSPIGDRTIFELTEPSKRWGFDVGIRYTDTIEKIISTAKISIEEEID